MLPIDEQFKLIRAGIDFSNIDRKKKVILVTSPESGTGKSTIAAHLASAYAQKGERTLLIDADMRRPTLHKRFMKNLHLGLSNIITKDIALEDGLQIVQLEKHQFSILTSGTIPPTPNDLLSSQKMHDLMLQLKDSFETIIIDTPPVTVVSDALDLASLVDEAVLVCRYQQTQKDKAKQAVSLLKLSNVKLLGVIFNGTKNIENNYY